MRNKLLRGVLVGLAALAAAGFLDSLHVFRPLEWKTWDARMRLFADPARASKDIVLVLVDEYSLDIYKKEQSLAWPWPREIYAYLIRYLKSGGAAACYFDFALSDDSIRGISDDQALARAAADAGNVFFVIALSTEEKERPEAFFLVTVGAGALDGNIPLDHRAAAGLPAGRQGSGQRPRDPGRRRHLPAYAAVIHVPRHDPPVGPPRARASRRRTGFARLRAHGPRRADDCPVLGTHGSVLSDLPHRRPAQLHGPDPGE
jgi:hypothetical protein